MYSLLDGPYDVVRLPIHNGEIVHPGKITYCVGMIINGGSSRENFLKPSPKVPCIFPYIFLIKFQPVTPIPVSYSTFCVLYSLSLETPACF